MPSSKKPRKKKSLAVSSLPITIRHSAEAETALQLAPHAELMKFREGIASEQSWHTITARLNVGLIAGRNRGLTTQSIESGLAAMLKVKARNEKTGKWLLSGNDLKDIGQALNDTDSIQLSSTRKQFAQAIKYVFENAAH